MLHIFMGSCLLALTVTATALKSTGIIPIDAQSYPIEEQMIDYTAPDSYMASYQDRGRYDKESPIVYYAEPTAAGDEDALPKFSTYRGYNYKGGHLKQSVGSFPEDLTEDIQTTERIYQQQHAEGEVSTAETGGGEGQKAPAIQIYVV